MTLDIYFDFKSPYSYVSIRAWRNLAEQVGMQIRWKPISLPIQAMSATYGTLENRSTLQMNKVRYLYVDCRRLRPDLTIRAPIQYYDSSLSAAAYYYVAKYSDRGEGFIDRCFEQVFGNRMAPDSKESLMKLIEELRIDTEDFSTNHDLYVAQAKNAWTEFTEHGGFGIPTAVYDDEIFWGVDRLELLKDRIQARTAANP